MDHKYGKIGHMTKIFNLNSTYYATVQEKSSKISALMQVKNSTTVIQPLFKSVCPSKLQNILAN